MALPNAWNTEDNVIATAAPSSKSLRISKTGTDGSAETVSNFLAISKALFISFSNFSDSGPG